MSDQDTAVTGEGSILDKIIASKEDQEKQQFNPADVITQLLKTISDKEADVLQRRFGLNDRAQETLEAIGSSYNVTRERIRQIENLAIKKIKDQPSFAGLMRGVEHVVLSVLEHNGNVMNEENLLDELFVTGRSKNNDQAVLFLLAELLDHRVKSIGPSNKFSKSWYVNSADLEFVEQSIGMLIDIIKLEDQPLQISDLYNKVKAHEFYKQHQDKLSYDVVVTYLQASAKIDSNPFDEYGLTKWGSIVPKRMNDKIYLVLKKAGKPIHFVDIAKKITEIFKKEAYPPTVHNELILNKHYVLVGRGIYALSEWGFRKGVVADVIAEILRKNSEPMTRKEIVQAVLDQRIVKKNTIHLALTNKKRFSKLSDGRYVLVESTSI